MPKKIQSNLDFTHVVVEDDPHNRYLKHCYAYAINRNGDLDETAAVVQFTAYDYATAEKHNIHCYWHCRPGSYLEKLWEVVCSSYATRARLPIHVWETVQGNLQTGVCIIIDDLLIADGYLSRENDLSIIRQFTYKVELMFDFVVVGNPKKVTPGVRQDLAKNPDRLNQTQFWSACGFFFLDYYTAIHWQELSPFSCDNIDLSNCFDKSEILFNYGVNSLNNYG